MPDDDKDEADRVKEAYAKLLQEHCDKADKMLKTQLVRARLLPKTNPKPRWHK
jgi:hypothetical protein